MEETKLITDNVFEEFKKFDKLIGRKILTKVISTRVEYTRELLDCYNSYISTINPIFAKADQNLLVYIRQTYLQLKHELIKFTLKLKLNNLPIPIDGYRSIDIANADLTLLFTEAEKEIDSENENQHTNRFTNHDRVK